MLGRVVFLDLHDFRLFAVHLSGLLGGALVNAFIADVLILLQRTDISAAAVRVHSTTFEVSVAGAMHCSEPRAAPTLRHISDLRDDSCQPLVIL